MTETPDETVFALLNFVRQAIQMTRQFTIKKIASNARSTCASSLFDLKLQPST